MILFFLNKINLREREICVCLYSYSFMKYIYIILTWFETNLNIYAIPVIG